MMGKICEQFEAETSADSEATRKIRFETVLDLMQQVRLSSACLLVLSLGCLVEEASRKEAILPNPGGGGSIREAT